MYNLASVDKIKEVSNCNKEACSYTVACDYDVNMQLNNYHVFSLFSDGNMQLNNYHVFRLFSDGNMLGRCNSVARVDRLMGNNFDDVNGVSKDLEKACIQQCIIAVV